MRSGADTSLHVVIAGASGFLGTHLTDTLVARGHDVTALVRGPTTARGRSEWNPYIGQLDRSVIESADVVVNLAGSPTLGNPHSRRWRRELRASRVITTHVLAVAVAVSERKPAFLAGNAVGFYGDHGAEPLTETAESTGGTLMSDVCIDWQAATQPAVDAGARVCVLRTAPIMDRRSAPLKQLRLLFGAGLGGRIGHGDQFFPMVSLRDWLGGVVHLAEHPSASGPVNICCADTPTNAEFTRALAHALHRPAVVRVPAGLVKAAAGAAAPEVLGSINVQPEALEGFGYEVRDRDVAAVLTAGLQGVEPGER